MDHLKEFDRFIITGVQKLPGWSHPIMIFSSYAGSPVTVAMILIVAMFGSYWYKNQPVFNASATLALALPLISLIKLLTKRVRPDTIYVKNMRFKTYSFPSGHACASVLAFGFLAHLALRYLSSPWSWLVAGPMVALIFLVGLSRVYLGAHFPSDVFAGWILGAVVLLLVIKYLA